MCWTSAASGDLANGPGDDASLHAEWGTNWVRAKQVHGSYVAVVGSLEDSGQTADGLVTVVPDLPLAIRTADCAPVALWSKEGVVGAVHAGWRSAVSGVLTNATQMMRSLGATRITAAVGPFIHAECYEFSPEELDLVAKRWGEAVRSVTSWGAPALDMESLLRVCGREADLAFETISATCTGCSPEYFSYRMKQSPERQAMLVKRRL